MHEDVKKEWKVMLKQGPQGRLKMESMRNTATKKAYLNFEDFFSVVDVVI